MICTTRISAPRPGVDAFLIGSELRGITQVRSGASAIRRSPARRPRGDVRAVLGRAPSSATPPTGRIISDTTRRTARGRLLPPRPALGRRQRRFRRHRQLHAARRLARRARPSRRASFDAITDLDYLRGNVEGGEGFDWFYASAADREAQVRTPITDGAHGQAMGLPLQGHPRLVVEPAPQPPGGSRAAHERVGAGDQKPIRFTESAARRSTADRTSRTSSTTRSRPRASCRTSPAAGATTPCSAASRGGARLLGPSRNNPVSGSIPAG